MAELEITMNAEPKKSLVTSQYNFMKKDEHGNAVCTKCNHTFGMKELTAINKANMRGLGLCPECYNAYKKATKLSAFAQLRNAIISANLSDKQVAYLLDRNFTQLRSGIAYNIIIPYDKDSPKTEQLQRYKKARYSAQPITIANKDYLLTNDVYLRNIPRVQKMLEEIKNM